MIRRFVLPAGAVLVAIVFATAAQAAEPPCELTPRTACFGLESVDASLSTTQAGAHPNLTFSFQMKQDPESEPNEFGLRDGYATPRDIRFELPPGLIGDPNVLGAPQQCTARELINWETEGCPNGSQVGVTAVYGYELHVGLTEPVYMMQPPGGDVVARLGTIAGNYPTFIDLRVRSEGDYGIVAEVSDAPVAVRLVKLETTTWGVPADPGHDTERCTPAEAISGITKCESRPPGSRPLPFMTNPTRCGVPLEMRVAASSWNAPDAFDTVTAPFPAISGCDNLPFGPSLTLDTTSRRTDSPTGADITLKLPASEGVSVREPSQMRDLRIEFPAGLVFNPGAGDGLGTCSPAQVGLGTREASHCPDAAKLASTEFDIPVLERNLRGAVYLREPEPGHPFRAWITADDLGLHIKLPGELEVDKQTGQVTSITTEIPQAPIREAKIDLKSGFRAPLITPQHCGTFETEYEFTPWSGGSPKAGTTQMQITEGCDSGGFAPKLSAGSTDAKGGAFAPFTFTLTREDGEQNVEGLNITLPKGISASFAGVARCEGADAQTGNCRADSRVGKVIAAVGAGSAPLWVPQQGKRPTAVYLSGPYKGAPLSIVAVVPKQAGPFDFGDEVIRSAIFVDPETAQATAKADPLPQLVEGIPITYKTINVQLDRPDFSLNPTSCARKETVANLTSSGGKSATASSSFAVTDCARLPFKPTISFRLLGGTHRGAHPKLQAVLKTRPGDANLAGASVALPRSEFLDQGHIKTVCTRVQFAAHQCPAGSVYGHAMAKTLLFDFPLKGDAILRSSSHPLPDLVLALHGPPSTPIEVDVVGRIDSINGGIRTTFDTIPDAPVSRFTLEMQGGKKGLLQNSADLCASTHRATAKFNAQNGRAKNLHPALQTSCSKAARKHKKQHK
jgi:hypothetical protein